MRERPLALLAFFALLLWLPGFFTVPPLDRDESRFAQATKQMLETGDFVAIRLGEEARDQKPVGIYWLQAASTAALSNLLPAEDAYTTIWTYRVPSLLSGLAALFLTFIVVRLFASAETAFLAALLLGSTLLLMVETKIAKTDSFLLATVIGAQAVAMRVYLSERIPSEFAPPGMALLLAGWIAFALGILVKGPIIVLVCGLTLIAISAWDRKWRWLGGLRPFTGLIVTLVIVAPWLIAIGIATEGAFFVNSLGGDFAAKFAGGQESHGAPPGTFALLAFVTFWPASLILLPAIWFGWRNRNEPVVRFLLVWAATTWLMFEVTPTKLPHYVLPAYPALAMLGAMWLTRPGEALDTTRLGRLFRLVSPAIFLGVAAVLAALLLWAPFALGDGPAFWTYGVGALGLALALVASIFAWRGRRIDGVFMGAFTAVTFYILAWHGAAPALVDVWLSPRLAEAVLRHATPADPPLVIAGYAEPSAQFLLGTRTELVGGRAAGERVAVAGGLAVVEANEEEAFLDSIRAAGLNAAVLERIDGLNYSNGRRLSLALYRVAPR